MKYKVNVYICDRGFLVEDGDHMSACNDGKELINCLSRTKAAVEADELDEEE